VLAFAVEAGSGVGYRISTEAMVVTGGGVVTIPGVVHRLGGLARAGEPGEGDGSAAGGAALPADGGDPGASSQ